MTELSERLKERYFGSDEHPYLTFEHKVEQYLRPEDTLLDAGCGWTAPVLAKYRGKARRLIGVDLVDFPAPVDGIELLNTDLATIPIDAGSVDIVMCRSVMEHVVDPLYRQVSTVLHVQWLPFSPRHWIREGSQAARLVAFSSWPDLRCLAQTVTVSIAGVSSTA